MPEVRNYQKKCSNLPTGKNFEANQLLLYKSETLVSGCIQNYLFTLSRQSNNIYDTLSSVNFVSFVALNFPKKSSAGGVWNLKLDHCKNQPLTQLFWKKSKLTNLCRISSNLLKNCIFADFSGYGAKTYIDTSQPSKMGLFCENT